MTKVLRQDGNMKCSLTGVEHRDYDFDGNGESTTGCDCINDYTEGLDPDRIVEDGPEGEESYENPEGCDD